MKWRGGWIVPGEQYVQSHTQCIDVRAGIHFCAAVLFRGGIAHRAHRDRIVCLAWFEHTRDAKFDQLALTSAIDYDVVCV